MGKESEMLEILLVRHGQTDWNVEKRVMGRLDVPLNDIGKKQAEGIAQYLASAKIDAIHASPVLRAAQTAQAIASKHPKIKIIMDERLSEINYGDWVKKSFADVEREYPEVWKNYHLKPAKVEIPGGESIADVAKRTKELIDDVISSYSKGRVVFVSHADVIKVALLNLLSMDMDRIYQFGVDNCSMTLVRIDPDIGPRIILYNHRNGFGNDL
ncbi:MAG TPA: histidine phosphatase family protein [bacterium]|nr:histidine phosphatase family protein [Myxococcales bacterium]HPW45152.1 histidine phosphatase family protein [bacterium]